MKGVIALALKDMVKDNHGKNKWINILKNVGIDKEPIILPTTDLDDQLIIDVIKSTCKELDISLKQAADAFGNYWVNTYSQKLYGVYYQINKTARDFILSMDKVHQDTTQSIPDARPPQFDYEWDDDKTLIMKYISDRGLIDIMVGLIKGVGKFYNENLKVSKINNNRVKIIFQN